MSDNRIAEVTQADRDAALPFIETDFRPGDTYSTGYYVRRGERDEHPLVQAFARHREAHRTAASQASERQNRLQKYLVDEAQARERLATFPDAVRQRLTNWQEGQSEWFGCTVLEIVAEFIAFEAATLAAPPTSDAGERRWYDALRKAARTVLNGLGARIEDAQRKGEPVPVFWGIADLHDALALSPPTSGEEMRLREAAQAVLDGLDRRIEAASLSDGVPIFEGIAELRAALKGAE